MDVRKVVLTVVEPLQVDQGAAEAADQRHVDTLVRRDGAAKRLPAHTLRERPCQYGSRSRRLKILPVSSRGRLSWKVTTLGTL